MGEMRLKVKDFSQKRRNSPIEITDVAISKIRYTKFDGFSIGQEEFIRERHQELLREAQKLNLINNTNRMEVGILIDIHTWEYWIIHGSNNEVRIYNNVDAYARLETAHKNQLMFMHNHPSTGTFSGADLKYFCNHDTLYIITAIGNDGTIYSLTKTADFNIAVLAEYERLALFFYRKGHINNNGTLAMKEILNRAKEFGLRYKKGGHK